jgi:hypothetical protein
MEFIDGKPLEGPLPVAKAAEFHRRFSQHWMPRIAKGLHIAI